MSTNFGVTSRRRVSTTAVAMCAWLAALGVSPVQGQTTVTPFLTCVELVTMPENFTLTADASAGATSIAMAPTTPSTSLPDRPFMLATLNPGGANEETVILTRAEVSPSVYTVSMLANSHVTGELVVVNGQRAIGIFGYENPGAVSVTVPIGEPANYFFPSPQDRGQIDRFSPGLRQAAFAIIWDPIVEPQITWILEGESASASATSTPCQGDEIQLEFLGAWSASTVYGTGDVVSRDGSSWVAARENLNVTPGVSDDWLLLAQAGATGPAGPAGPQGPTGETGPTGLQGATGPEGPTGPAGATGPQGPAGPEGATGPVGPQGEAGPAGPEGAAGPQGATGPQGETGPQGPTGPQGEIGLQGATGPAGPVGPQGEAGPAGPEGAAGPQGETGLQGATGPAGPAGPQGATGPAGPAGPEGATGAAGAPGPQGVPGPPGPQGPQGPSGESGARALADRITVEAESTGESTAIAECPVGYQLLTGGGSCQAAEGLASSMPISATAWQVTCPQRVVRRPLAKPRTTIARAICVAVPAQ
jgi:hypothetical protein